MSEREPHYLKYTDLDDTFLEVSSCDTQPAKVLTAFVDLAIDQGRVSIWEDSLLDTEVVFEVFTPEGVKTRADECLKPIKKELERRAQAYSETIGRSTLSDLETQNLLGLIKNYFEQAYLTEESNWEKICMLNKNKEILLRRSTIKTAQAFGFFVAEYEKV